jgi:peptide/nickel transport system ATP-binding protein
VVVRHISDRIVVLYLGKVMEVAPADELFAAPLHSYTRHLISAVPIPDAAMERRRQHLQLNGEPPSAVDPPSGCRFRTRCPIAKPVCAEQMPPLALHHEVEARRATRDGRAALPSRRRPLHHSN